METKEQNKRQEELVQAVLDFQQGKEEAFGRLYEKTKKYVFYTIRKSVQDDSLAEDIMQETWLEVYRGLSALKNGDAVLGWIMKIAHHKIYHYLGRQPEPLLESGAQEELFSEIEQTDASLMPEEVAENREVKRLIGEIIDGLPGQQRQTVVAFYYNQMSIREIAETYGIPENTVKSHLARGKNKIREGILKLEKEQGTKLYGVSLPAILFLVFGEEAQACEIPAELTAHIMQNAGKQKIPGQGSAKQAAATARTAAGTATAKTAVAGTGLLVKIGLAAAGLAAVAGISFVLVRNHEIHSHIENGQQDIAAANYEEGIAEYASVLEIDPDHEQAVTAMQDAYVGWAQTLLDDGQYEKAVEVLNSAPGQVKNETLDGKLAEANLLLKKQELLERLEALRTEGKYEEALPVCDDLLALDGEDEQVTEKLQEFMGGLFSQLMVDKEYGRVKELIGKYDGRMGNADYSSLLAQAEEKEQIEAEMRAFMQQVYELMSNGGDYEEIHANLVALQDTQEYTAFWEQMKETGSYLYFPQEQAADSGMGAGAYISEINGKSYYYCGSFKDGVPDGNGYGFMYGDDDDPSDLVYDGEWKQGKPNGAGTLWVHIENGNNIYNDFYEGNWTDGLCDGEIYIHSLRKGIEREDHFNVEKGMIVEDRTADYFKEAIWSELEIPEDHIIYAYDVHWLDENSYSSTYWYWEKDTPLGFSPFIPAE